MKPRYLLLWLACAGFCMVAAQATDAETELTHIIDNLRELDIGQDLFFPNSIYTDSEGFMWLGMRNSLVRYDGNDCTEFGYHPVNNRGMLTAGPEIIREHPNGDLWIASWSVGLAIFNRKTEQFKRVYADPETPDALSSDRISDVYISPDGEVWIGTKDFVLHKYVPEKNAFLRFPCPLPDLATSRNLEQTHLGEILADPQDKNTLWIGTQFGLVKFNIRDEQFDFIPIDRVVTNRYEVLPTALYIDDRRQLWFGHFNREGLKVFDIPTGTWKKKYAGEKEFDLAEGSFRIHNIYPILDSFVIANTSWDHFIMVNTANLEDFAIMPYLNARRGNLGIFVDQQSSEILIGLGSLILKYGEHPQRFPFFSFYQFFEGRVKGNWQRGIYHDTAHSQYLISTHGGDGVLKLSENMDRMEPVRYKSKPGFEHMDVSMLALAPRNDSIFIASDEGVLVLDPAREVIAPYTGECHSGHYTQVPLYHLVVHNGMIWVAMQSGGIGRVACAENGIAGKEFICRKIEIINDTLFALATDRGLRLFQPDAHEFVHAYTDSTSIRLLTDFEIWDLDWEDNALWIGTRGNGLARMTMRPDGTFDTDFYISGSHQGSNVINSVLLTKERELWTATDYGFSNINIETGEYESYGLADGIGFRPRGPWLQQLSKGVICASATTGFHMFDPKTLRASYAPVRPYLQDIEVMGQSVERVFEGDRQSLTLRAGDDHVTFIMGALNTNYGQSRNNYRYRLVGYDEDWIVGYDDPVAHYTKLPGGKYTFEFTASPKGHQWNDETVSVAVDVRYGLIESPYFKAGIAFAGIMLIAVFYRVIQLRRKRKMERLEMQAQLLMLEKDYAESELKALRAQMNPHFLHNALNSINWYILKGKPEEAREYIVKFSRLIRMILEHSKNETISLAEELENVQLYVELEAMRLDESFHWSLEVDETLNTAKTRFPPLILQPFVENAIWHGLLPKTGEKRLQIEVIRKDDLCCIEIKDNGVGRGAASQKKNERKQRSRGIEITRQRLANFSPGNSTEPLHIVDLFSNGSPSGTLVRINLAFVYSSIE